MFKFIKLKKKTKESREVNKRLLIKSGVELLDNRYRKDLLIKIKRLLSITDEVWSNHYLFSINRFAEMVQAAPASELHHHNYNGGLIDHTLETVYLGIKSSHGYVVPPNTRPEEISSNIDKWRFGIFIAILCHDIGKIVTDIEFVYKKNNIFINWHPWTGKIPLGSEYCFRYKKKVNNTKVAKSLHEKTSISLLPYLLTTEATQWLFSDEELISQVINTITHSSFGGELIGEIAITADKSSVSKNMGGVVTNQQSYIPNNVPFHQKLLTSLVELANNGTLKRNKPGAALWVTDKFTWVVSKAVMESVQSQLLEEGHTGIPRNIVRFFRELNEHNLIIKTPSGESVWKAEINDFSANWKQKLTFLKFENSTIWPVEIPKVFEGSVTELPEHNSKKKKNESTNMAVKEMLEEEKNSVAVEGDGKLKPVLEAEIVLPEISFENEAKETKVNIKPIDFFDWLLTNIKSRKLRINEPEAKVHLTDDYLILVSPAIFVHYLSFFKTNEGMYDDPSDKKPPYKIIQREVERLNIHKKGLNGSNIIKINIKGFKSTSSIFGYALDRKEFKSLAHLSANKALTIDKS